MTKSAGSLVHAGRSEIGLDRHVSRVGELVFLSAQAGLDPETGELEVGVEAQTRRALANVESLLHVAGCTSSDILRLTLILSDLNDFRAVDAIYAGWLPGRGFTARPVRTAFQAEALPGGALLLLDVVATCTRPM